MIHSTSFAKTAHGIKDIYVHFTQDMSQYDHALKKEKAYASFKNEQCRKCHGNIINIPDKRGAMVAHRDVLFARYGYVKKCIDCHHNLVHMTRDAYAYKQYQDAYQGLGF
ncbi:MAG: NapC/NirT family cytochrome c [Thermodesulfobacteriota bacterium]|nr:NapC/NirT family cytochrome c [Thermodesulfobacteriota bacterium]